MQDPSDEMLMALADNELRPEEAAILRARIAASPALAERYAIFTESRAALQAAFASDDPVPDALIRAIETAPLGTEQRTAEIVPLRPRATVFAWPKSLAAGLVLAVGLGGLLAGRALAPGGGMTDPARLAAASLETALTGTDVALPQGAAARVVGSYETDHGLCRLIELTMPGAGSERAVVCRDEGRTWSVVAAVAGASEGTYISASDSAAQLIDDVLDDLGAGPALDPAAEAAALAR